MTFFLFNLTATLKRDKRDKSINNQTIFYNCDHKQLEIIMETPNPPRPHKLSLDEFQEKIQQHLLEVLQAEVKQESEEPLFEERVPRSTEEKTRNLIQKLYGDYFDDTNVELPSFLIRNYQLNWKKKIVRFVGK